MMDSNSALERRRDRVEWHWRSGLAEMARAVLRIMAGFTGLVTGVGLLLTFGAVELSDAGDRYFSGAADFGMAVLFFWIVLLIPSCLLAGLHTMIAWLAAERGGERHARAFSVAAAVVLWPLLTLSDSLRHSLHHWGLPAALVLGLYGWYRGGMMETGGVGTPFDRAIERVGLLSAGTLLLCLVILTGHAWLSSLPF